MKKIKILITLAFMAMFMAIFAISTSAAAYEPDGTSATEYKYSASECNRKVVVTFKDTSGNVLKTVTVHTKHGEDDNIGITIYGYRVVGFESNGGPLTTCELTWASGNMWGQAGYAQFNVYFRTAASKKQLDVTITMEKLSDVEVTIKHMLYNQNGTETLYAKETKTVKYFEQVFWCDKSIPGYTLRSNHESIISGKFCYSWLDETANIDSDDFDWSLVNKTTKDLGYWSTFNESKHGNLSYSKNHKLTVYFRYDVDSYTISFDANGGTGAPESITKYFGTDKYLPATRPSRTGYSFMGWGTSKDDTTADYSCGYLYTLNHNTTLYAVWDINKYSVKYDANGGTGAPEEQTKLFGQDLKLSSTIPKREGYVFVGWGYSQNSRVAAYDAGEYYDIDHPVTFYAIWLKIEEYSISYDANGGIGAPDSQIKQKGKNILLSAVLPTREGYNFIGWNTDPNATQREYAPGQTYTHDSSIKLYAIWQTTCDFSVRGLTISNSSPYKYDTIGISIVVDSWDNKLAHKSVPIELLYDGEVVDTQYVDFDKNGRLIAKYSLNVGKEVGEHTVEIRVNWSNRDNEKDASNNNMSKTIEVKNYDYELTVDPLLPSDAYKEGITVITTFFVRNDGQYGIIPRDGNTATFTAYYLDSSNNKVIISSQRWTNIVVPPDATNIIYFKWSIPDGMAGKTVYCECVINSDFNISENTSNNKTTFSAVVEKINNYSVPDTQYEGKTPDSYMAVKHPETKSESASWTVWIYQGDQFILKRYGISVSCAKPTLIPSNDCDSAVYKDGRWTMASGYGVTINCTPSASKAADAILAESRAYTLAQTVVATFPEYQYKTGQNVCSSLENVGGSYQFTENECADDQRVHFVPVWYDDGVYYMSIVLTEMWTPLGVIEGVKNSEAINISGSLYNDWYQS